jgi:methionyl-tRNA synthetase
LFSSLPTKEKNAERFTKNGSATHSSSLRVQELQRTIESVIGLVSCFNAFIDQQAHWARETRALRRDQEREMHLAKKTSGDRT